MRYAVYFTPPPEDALTRAAEDWLGRSAFTGRDVAPTPSPGLTVEEIAAVTGEPRRYGFHATLKAPFRLAGDRSEAELLAALEAFCARRGGFAGPRLAVTNLDGFLALTPAEPSADLDRLAGDAVVAFEPFRAALTEAEVARRRPERLAAAERANLERWGYPHVFEAFRFHMTLTDRLDDARRPRFMAALEARFAPVLGGPLAVDGIALFREAEPGAPFTVHSLMRFAGTRAA